MWLWNATKKPKGFPPGPPRKPILGYASKIHPTKSHITYEALQKEYGDVSGIFMGSEPTVVVSGWEAVTEAMHNKDLNGRPKMPFLLSDFGNTGDLKGVMFANGEMWQTQRRFTLHNFRNLGFGKRSHEDHILSEVDELVKSLVIEKGPIDIQANLAVASINIIWAILAGSRYSYEDERLQALVRAICSAFRSGQQSGGGLLFAFPWIRHLAPKLSGFTNLENAANQVYTVVQEQIDNHRVREDPNETSDFLDLYFNELQKEDKHSSFTEPQLRSLCNDILTAGSETGSSLISYAILYMCLHPQWQETLHRELDEVLGEKGARLPSLEDKPFLPKTEAFLNEVMRLRCPAPTTVPHKATVDTTLQGYNIPKDTFLFFSIRSIMMDKEYWGDPEVFRPERFIDDDGKVKVYDRMIPFGKGKRACLGEPLARMTGILMFAGLVSRLSFSLPDDHPFIDEEGITGFTLGPPPFKVLVQSR